MTATLGMPTVLDMPSAEDAKSGRLRIGEAARMLGVSVDTMRRWEREGRIAATRTAGGERRFAAEDIERLLTGAA